MRSVIQFDYQTRVSCRGLDHDEIDRLARHTIECPKPQCSIGASDLDEFGKPDLWAKVKVWG